MSLPSGKFVLRVAPELHDRLREEARAHEISLNEWIVRSLTRTKNPSTSPIVDRLKSHCAKNLLGVVQFGSSVRQEMRENSDVDLLVVLENERSIDRSLYRDWDREFNTPEFRIFSPQFSHLPQGTEYSSLWLEVALEGEILFDPKGSIVKKLRVVREAIASGIYCRKMSHGQPYWTKKEDFNAK